MERRNRANIVRLFCDQAPRKWDPMVLHPLNMDDGRVEQSEAQDDPSGLNATGEPSVAHETEFQGDATAY